MEKIKISGKSLNGLQLEATFAPEKGMNLTSYKVNGLEIMDQTTNVLFEQRCAGLGAIIGPHFHHRKPENIPLIKDEYLFPHFPLLKEQGIKEPFSHGIARYVPWKVETQTSTLIKATLSSKSEWKGISLAQLEGQHFTMTMIAEIFYTGLSIDLSVISENDSMVGLHYYYALGKGPSYIESQVEPKYNDQGVWKNIPIQWMNEDKLKFDLTQTADFGFKPAPKPLIGNIDLHTSTHKLTVRYTCANKENSWQLYHPKGSSYVCIEPMSAHDPRRPKQTVNGIRAVLAVVPK